MLLSLLLYSLSGKSQLLVDPSLSADSLAQLISGEGVKIFNTQVDCGTNGFGKYDAVNTNLGVNSGLLITTGTVQNAVGPNSAGNTSTHWSNPYNGNPHTYTLLDNYSGRTTYEYCEFEFDIIPQGDTIRFDFVFASEEYEEWVGSQFNDVFGFFISGPGIVPDAGAGIYKNIALLPDGTTPVTINDVNQNINTTYYQNNNGGPHVEYDGFTQGLTAISRVTPCQTYHLKLVVADASDKIYDSGVFIEKITSNKVLLLSSTAGHLPYMVEGCNDGIITFKRPLGQPNTNPFVIQYWLDGTAQNGVDYNQIGSNPNPSFPKTVTIPAGVDSANVNVIPIQDGLAENSEYIMVYLGNPYCSNTIIDSLQFYIQDSLFSTASPPIDSICIGQSVQLNATGGYSYSWSPTTGLSNSTIPNPVATPSVTTSYTMTATASFCVDNRTVAIRVSDMTLNFTPTDVDCNGNNNGAVQLGVSNGFPSYAYSWTGPGSFASSNQNITGLQPGSYFVTVTDTLGCTDTGSVLVTEPPLLVANANVSSNYNGADISCYGQSDGALHVVASGGIPSYQYLWSTSSTTDSIAGLPAGSYWVIATDTNGCTDSTTVFLTEPPVLTSNAIVTSNHNGAGISCYGESDGALQVTATGGVPSYQYLWSNSSTGDSIVGLPAGSYWVATTDTNGCVDTSYVSLTQPDSMYVTGVVTNETCKGDTAGAIDLTVVGGTPAFSFNWGSSFPTTEDLNGLANGLYSVVVTDTNGCVDSSSFTIGWESDMAVSISANQPRCYGDSEGEIDLTMFNGVAPYGYVWSTGDTIEDLFGLRGGVYKVLVTDMMGCSIADSVTLVEPDSMWATVVAPTFPSGHHISENGLSNGSIDVTVGGGTSPYTYLWSPGGETTQDLANLPAGPYTVTVYDQNECTIQIITILTEPLELTISSGITPNGDGSNDAFIIKGLEAFTDNKLVIFNRWGSEVFEVEGYQNDWQGVNMNGQALPEGTYFYMLTIEGRDETFRGYIDLRR